MSETPDDGAQGAEAPLDFDPYRFGLPEHPVPPEYAPPGYVPPPGQTPPPDPATAYPGGYPPMPQNYPPQNYPPTGYPPAGSPPPGAQYPGGQYPGGQYPGGQYPSGYPSYGNQPYPPAPGYPPNPPLYNAQYPPPKTSNGRATAGMVLGIASILLCWTVFFDAIVVILGLIFSSLGRTAAVREPRLGGKGMATTGLVCSVVGAVLAITLSVLVVRATSACNEYPSNSSSFNTCVEHYLHLK